MELGFFPVLNLDTAKLNTLSVPSAVVNADGGTVVKVLCYKSEGRWFDSR
jgi:hypothetical protein